MTTENNGTKKTLHRLTLHDKNEILNLFKQGTTGKEIHEITKLPYHSIIYYLAKVKERGGIKKAEKDNEREQKKLNGVTRAKLTPQQIAEIYALWDSGKYTRAAVGEKVGVHGSTVTNYLDARDAKQAKVPKKAAKPEESSSPALKTTSLKDQLVQELKQEIMAKLKDEILRDLLK